MIDQTPVVIHSDGACSGNPGPGGWAAVLQYGGHEKVLQGGASLTTNNRMEMRAAIAGFETLTRACRVEFYTDSEYLRQGITRWLSGWLRNGWQTKDRRPVKNQDLWRLLHTVMRKYPHEISWHWVKGHAGDALNERVDRLAVQAIQQYGLKGRPDMEHLDAAVPE